MATKQNSSRSIEQKHERFWLTVRYGEKFNDIPFIGRDSLSIWFHIAVNSAKVTGWMDANVGDLKTIVVLRKAAMFIDIEVY